MRRYLKLEKKLERNPLIFQLILFIIKLTLRCGWTVKMFSHCQNKTSQTVHSYFSGTTRLLHIFREHHKIDYEFV